MWTSGVMSCALVFAVGQVGELKVDNLRATYGFLGPAREGFRVPPGEWLYIAFDILGLKPDKDNNLSFSSTMEIRDAAGKVIQPLKDLGVVQYNNVLAGTRTQHTVLIKVPEDFKAGKYDLKVSLEDKNGKSKTSFNRGFEVADAALGLVRFQITSDIGNVVPLPTSAAVGQAVFVNAFIVGHKADAKTGHATVRAEMTILDEQNKPVGPPLGRDFQIPADVPAWHVQFDLPVTRAGRFKIQLKATDAKEKKTHTLTVPFVAVEVK